MSVEYGLSNVSHDEDRAASTDECSRRTGGVGGMDWPDQIMAFDVIEGLGRQKSHPTALLLSLLQSPLLT